MPELSIHDIRIVPEFKNVPDEQLQWLLEKGKTNNFQKGERIFNTGDLVNKLYIFIEGKARTCIVQNNQLREFRSFEPGNITGYLPFSRATNVPGFCECLTDVKVFVCAAESIRESITKHYELTAALVHMMTTRVRDIATVQQQNEKMFALGKLSAGLAHELNNPAAAISRAAALLQKQVNQLPHLFKTVSLLHINEEKINKIQQLIHYKINNAKAQVSMLQKAALEDELSDWLYKNDLKDIDTEGLTDLGFTIHDLNTIKSCSSGDELHAVLEWISNYVVTNKMAEDIRVSSEHISQLVGAVKNFTFMDRATDKQLINLHTSIQNTLTMLNYKLKKANINVIENYDAAMPAILVMPGELNQVWMNLIDNAIDAMEQNKNGNLIITTTHDNRFVKVHIKDNGTGISKEMQQKIFDPFFTTKEIGKGTGLGLDVVSRIVQMHKGTVKVKSEPGETEFEVCLPSIIKTIK